MSLPGGINVAGELRRDFRFRPITGELELTLGESMQHAESHAASVTAVLCQALDTIGGVAASVNAIRGLCVGDRQFLMSQLAVHIDDQPVWLTAVCNICQEPFDISYRYADLPVKTAGDAYPQTAVDTSLGVMTVRMPTGADQERIAAAVDESSAMSELLRSIVAKVDVASEVEPDELSDADIAAIEQAVEAMAPEIATELLAHCPHCDAHNTVSVNTYVCLERPLDELFTEVHTIASHYHWSEQAILALPRARRQTYLHLIDLGRLVQGPIGSIQAT